MMQSKKNAKSGEESLERKTPEISERLRLSLDMDKKEDDPIGLKELCPFQDQGIIEVHCRSDCAWYSEDQCCIWDLLAALQGIRTSLEQLLKVR